MNQPLLDKIPANKMELQTFKLSSNFSISKKELINCMNALTKERKYDEELNLLEKLFTDPGIEAGLQTNFKNGINGSQEDLLNRNNAFGNNEKPEVITKLNFYLFTIILAII